MRNKIAIIGILTIMFLFSACTQYKAPEAVANDLIDSLDSDYTLIGHHSGLQNCNECFSDIFEYQSGEEVIHVEVVNGRAHLIEEKEMVSEDIEEVMEEMHDDEVHEEVMEEVEEVMEEIDNSCSQEEIESEVCNNQYDPVCGDNGRTYTNRCRACASGNVETVSEGICPREEKEETVEEVVEEEVVEEKTRLEELEEMTETPGQDDRQKIAEEFVENQIWYKTGGEQLDLVDDYPTGTENCDDCHSYVYQYTKKSDGTRFQFRVDVVGDTARLFGTFEPVSDSKFVETVHVGNI